MPKATPFLETVIAHYIGPPHARIGSDDRAAWYCPFCDSSNPRLQIKPPDGKRKTRWKCFRCERWGDEFDFLRNMFPERNYEWRMDTLDQLKEGKQVGNDSEYMTARQEEHRQDMLRAAWAEWRQHEFDERRLEYMVLEAEHYEAEGITALDILEFQHEAERWILKHTQEHYMECDDEECDDAICRFGRGLEPLTPEEIQDKRDPKWRKQHWKKCEAWAKRVEII